MEEMEVAVLLQLIVLDLLMEDVDYSAVIQQVEIVMFPTEPFVRRLIAFGEIGHHGQHVTSLVEVELKQ